MRPKIYCIPALLSVVLTALMLSGCGNDPVSPEPESKISLEITVKDENGNPYGNAYVYIFPSEKRRYTGSNGIALFSNLEPGTYQVMVDAPNLPLFYKNIPVSAYETTKAAFVIASRATVNVVLNDEHGDPVTNVEVGTVPSTGTILVDENGMAVLENIPISSYRFVVKRGEYEYTSEPIRIVISDNVVQDIIVIVPSLKPQITVLAPGTSNTVNGLEPLTFNGDGWDFEDEYLPEEAFQWTSSLDGPLGTGREVTVDHLGVGYHDITFTATDSHGGSTSRTFTLDVSQYIPDSRFPLAYHANWSYRYLTPEFTLEKDDGTKEDWRLSNLVVEMITLDSRESLLNYTVYVYKDSIGGDENSLFHVKDYSYLVTDYFQTIGDDLFLTRSDEHIELIDSNILHQKIYRSTVDLTSVYTPSYAVLPNYVSPVPGDSYAETVTTNVFWYDSFFRDKASYNEEIEVETSSLVGSSVSVDTDLGSYETIPITMKMGNSTRKWWLAEGIGIVRLEYDTTGFPLVAVLEETNMTDIRDDFLGNAAQKPVMTPSPGVHPVFKSPFTTAHDSPERILEMSRFIRSIIP